MAVINITILKVFIYFLSFLFNILKQLHNLDKKTINIGKTSIITYWLMLNSNGVKGWKKALQIIFLNNKITKL